MGWLPPSHRNAKCPRKDWEWEQGQTLVDQALSSVSQSSPSYQLLWMASGASGSEQKCLQKLKALSQGALHPSDSYSAPGRSVQDRPQRTWGGAKNFHRQWAHNERLRHPQAFAFSGSFSLRQLVLRLYLASVRSPPTTWDPSSRLTSQRQQNVFPTVSHSQQGMQEPFRTLLLDTHWKLNGLFHDWAPSR